MCVCNEMGSFPANSDRREGFVPKVFQAPDYVIKILCINDKEFQSF